MCMRHSRFAISNRDGSRRHPRMYANPRTPVRWTGGRVFAARTPHRHEPRSRSREDMSMACKGITWSRLKAGRAPRCAVACVQSAQSAGHALWRQRHGRRGLRCCAACARCRAANASKHRRRAVRIRWHAVNTTRLRRFRIRRQAPRPLHRADHAPDLSGEDVRRSLLLERASGTSGRDADGKSNRWGLIRCRPSARGAGRRISILDSPLANASQPPTAKARIASSPGCRRADWLRSGSNRCPPIIR